MAQEMRSRRPSSSSIEKMEFRLSGNSLKIFARSITCLARIGTELVFQSSSSQLTLNTLNSSRSAFQSITFKQDFFDVYTVSSANVKCSVFLKAICSVLRTQLSIIDNLVMLLADPDASKVQWALNCSTGMKKTYWITCNVEPDFQQLSLDRDKFPSSFVVRPRDLNRLLANFQSNLQEITVIATQPFVFPPDAVDQIGGKAVEFRSYIDPTKENDSSLHTQLWIDPGEEFVQYTHSGDPVDVTFGVKELKAFLSFCESCEVDVHLYFEKAGEPILMTPKFGLDDGSSSNFETTLVLATMLASQIDAGNSSEPQPAGNTGAFPQQGARGNNNTEHPSDQTKIWSELSGSAARDGNNAEHRPVSVVRNLTTREQSTIQRVRAVNISADVGAELIPDPDVYPSIYDYSSFFSKLDHVSLTECLALALTPLKQTITDTLKMIAVPSHNAILATGSMPMRTTQTTPSCASNPHPHTRDHRHRHQAFVL